MRIRFGLCMAGFYMGRIVVCGSRISANADSGMTFFNATPSYRNLRSKYPYRHPGICEANILIVIPEFAKQISGTHPFTHTNTRRLPLPHHPDSTCNLCSEKTTVRLHPQQRLPRHALRGRYYQYRSSHLATSDRADTGIHEPLPSSTTGLLRVSGDRYRGHQTGKAA